jgi:hypothetical protein
VRKKRGDRSTVALTRAHFGAIRRARALPGCPNRVAINGLGPRACSAAPGNGWPYSACPFRLVNGPTFAHAILTTAQLLAAIG